jgi:hypothetical protein
MAKVIRETLWPVSAGAERERAGVQGEEAKERRVDELDASGFDHCVWLRGVRTVRSGCEREGDSRGWRTHNNNCQSRPRRNRNRPFQNPTSRRPASSLCSPRVARRKGLSFDGDPGPVAYKSYPVADAPTDLTSIHAGAHCWAFSPHPAAAYAPCHGGDTHRSHSECLLPAIAFPAAVATDAERPRPCVSGALETLCGPWDCSRPAWCAAIILMVPHGFRYALPLFLSLCAGENPFRSHLFLSSQPCLP